MQKEAKEIKNCPFCGSETEIKNSGYFGNPKFQVICCNSECFLNYGVASFYSSRKEAIQAWNKSIKESVLYYSYRDINDELQHVRANVNQELSEYLGNLETQINKLKAFIKDFNEHSKKIKKV